MAWSISLLATALTGACDDGDAADGEDSRAASARDASTDAHSSDAGLVDSSAANAAAADGVGAPKVTRLAVVTLVAGADDSSTGYLRFVPTSEISGTELKLEQARELAGNADVWILGKHAFVSTGDAPVVTKYEIKDNDELREIGSLGFENYGVADAAFWNNTFVSETKAYLTGTSASELIVWNPTAQASSCARCPRPARNRPRARAVSATCLIRALAEPGRTRCQRRSHHRQKLPESLQLFPRWIEEGST
jgi:hypothetical protein